MSSEIEKAYKYCESVTKNHAKSFYFAAKFLPKSKQKPIYALIALCRHVDDEVDEAEVRSEAEAIAAVNNWKAKLDKIYETRTQKVRSEGEVEDQSLKTKDQNLVLLAWSDLLEKTIKSRKICRLN
jgi:phytoene synthase